MDKIDGAIDRWTEEVLPSRQEFKNVISKKKLVIYHGVDPTGPDLHLGHSTNYLLMRAFQEAGHKVILLIGDFTARIGDPSDKTAARKRLSDSEIKSNLETYKQQVSKILEFSGENPAKIEFNNKWLSKLVFKDVIELMSEFTFQQIIERDIFQKRLKEEKPLYMHELIYPLAQGYDSVAMKVDAEIGGTDQTFNMLVGRTLVKNHLGKEKFVISTPLLVNPQTGVKMMSKSKGNYIGINEDPNSMYGKIMALPDETTVTVFKLCTRVPLSEVDSIKSGLEAKKRLAWELVKLYHSEKDAKETQREFARTFQEQKPTYEAKIPLQDNLATTIAPFTTAKSISEAKRLINQGGVDVNGKTVDSAFRIKAGDKIKIGKKLFGTVV